MKAFFVVAALVAIASAAPAEEKVREKKATSSLEVANPISEHQPEARSLGYEGSYGSPCGLSAPYLRGPSVGLFPNSNIGGCAVPLLLSCSPRVSSGHIIKQYGYGAASYGGHPSYKESEDELEKSAGDKPSPPNQEAAMRSGSMGWQKTQKGQGASFYPEFNYVY